LKALNILAVGTGGSLGAILRYYINLQFSVGTLIENILGSFLLGLLTSWIFQKTKTEWIKLGLGTGLCGGFTTMSTFASETFSLFNQGEAWLGTIYLFISVIGGILSAYTGFSLGNSLSKKEFMHDSP
jgi:fluoride exporter